MQTARFLMNRAVVIKISLKLCRFFSRTLSSLFFCCVTRIKYHLRMLNDKVIVVGTMIGGDEHTVLFCQIFRRQFVAFHRRNVVMPHLGKTRDMWVIEVKSTPRSSSRSSRWKEGLSRGSSTSFYRQRRACRFYFP